jgi:hypothetical protein
VIAFLGCINASGCSHGTVAGPHDFLIGLVLFGLILIGGLFVAIDHLNHRRDVGEKH